MICYLDTSVLVCATTAAAASKRVQLWLAGQSADDLAISDWVVTEFAAALSIKRRRGDIGDTGFAGAMGAFNRLRKSTFSLLPVSPAAFQLGAVYAGQHGLSLRAGDALHLAICSENDGTLYTLDRQMHAAGLVLGTPARLL